MAISRKSIDRGFDFAVTWLSPANNVVLLVAATVAFQDIDHLRASFPDWNGAIDILASPWWVPVFFTTVAISLIGAIIAARQKKNSTRLRSELDAAENQLSEIANLIRPLFDGVLLNVSKRLGFEQDDQARLTVYLHRPDSTGFVPCGRYSPNPKARKPGRPWYPEDQGCIAAGWQNGWHFDNQIPQRLGPRKRYHQETYGIPEGVYDQLKMKPRLFAVRRIDDHAGNGVGVLVLEATQVDRFKEASSRRILAEVSVHFAVLLNTFSEYIADPKDAAERGL